MTPRPAGGGELGLGNTERGGAKWDMKLARLDFLILEGTNPREWVLKCQKYFQIHSITDGMRLENC